MHNFLSRDGTSPLVLLEAGREEVRRYGGQLLEARVQSAERRDAGFCVKLDDGRVVFARRLLVTTGLVDELPNLPGVRERWGRDVVHCAYCHGWEVRDQQVGVLATGPLAVHQALLFRQLTSDIVLFRHTAPPLALDESAQLEARDIRVVEGRVAALEVEDDRLTGVRLDDGTLVARQVVVVGAPMMARAEVLASLGLQPTPHPPGVGALVPADASGLTAVPGVWLAGNVTDLSATVVGAAAQGATAGAAINADLVAEDTRVAVDAARHKAADAAHGLANGHDHVPRDPRQLVTREFWNARYASAEAIWSGKPNAQLVASLSGVAPGTALELAAGEGADAIWLAQRGWRVTAIDISSVALERAATIAAAGPDVGDRITWQQGDALTWTPPSAAFDLVSMHFFQLPKAQRDQVYPRLAAAVRPGGRLLIVGHHPSDLATTMSRPKLPEWLFTPEEVAKLLDPTEWEVTLSAPAREAVDPHGRPMTIHDAVVFAVRRLVDATPGGLRRLE
jgi:thioredoxin reductase/SAM-dependent methyltransferase